MTFGQFLKAKRLASDQELSLRDAAKKLGGSVSFDVFKSLLVGFAESSVQQLIQAGLA